LSTAAANASSAFNLSAAASSVARSGTKVLQATAPTSGEYTCMNKLTCRPVMLVTLLVCSSAHSIDARVLPGPKRIRRLNRYMAAPIFPGRINPDEAFPPGEVKRKASSRERVNRAARPAMGPSAPCHRSPR
jgi:hypothetical protein